MRVGVRTQQWRLGISVLLVALGPLSGCGLGGRSAEYSYEPWDVSASGTAGPAPDAAAATGTSPVDAAGFPEASGAAGTPGGRVADPGTDVDALRTQVRQLREREQMLLHALDTVRTDQVRRSPAEASDAAANPAQAAEPDRPAGDGAAAPTENAQALADRVAGLHAELAEERRRRQAAEMQLERLRRETSQAPFGAPTVPEAAFLAAKQEIVYLRQALAEEKVARQRLAEDFGTLQRELARRPAGDDKAADSRSAQLEDRTGDAAASFQRTLAATEAETAALDRELAAAAAEADDDVSAVRAENTLLRQRLEDQRRRTQDLAAKLKLAVRVTDLIFKLEAQPRVSSARPARQARSTPARSAKARRTAPPRPAAATAAPEAPAPAPAPAMAPPQPPAGEPRKGAGEAPYPI